MEATQKVGRFGPTKFQRFTDILIYIYSFRNSFFKETSKTVVSSAGPSFEYPHLEEIGKLKRNSFENQ